MKKIIERFFKSRDINKYLTPQILEKILKIGFFSLFNASYIFDALNVNLKTKYVRHDFDLDKIYFPKKKVLVNYFDLVFYSSYFTNEAKKDFTKVILIMINIDKYFNNLLIIIKGFIALQKDRLDYLKNNNNNEQLFFEQEIEYEENEIKQKQKMEVIFLSKILNINNILEKIYQEMCVFKNFKNNPEMKKIMKNNFNKYLNKFLSKLFLKMRFDLLIKIIDNIYYIKKTETVQMLVRLILKLFIEIVFSNVDIEKKKIFLDQIKNISLFEKYSGEILYCDCELNKKLLLNNFRNMISQNKYEKEEDQIEIFKFIVENHSLFRESENFFNLLFDLYLKSVENSSISLKFITHLEFVLISNPKIDLISIIYSKSKNINLINLIKIKQRIELLSQEDQELKKSENFNFDLTSHINKPNLNYIQQFYLKKDFEQFKILELIIFFKNLDFSNLKENKELENLEDLLQLAKKDINKNKFLLDKFRRDFSYCSNSKFNIFGLNYLEEKNVFKKLSNLIFFQNDCLIYKLNLFLKFLLNSNQNLNSMSFKYEKSFKTMIINIFIFIVQFTHLLVFSKNFYQNWKKSEILFHCFHSINTILDIFNVHFINFKKITNTNFISSFLFLINLYTDYLGRKRQKIFIDFENFQKKNIEKFIKKSLERLDRMLFAMFEIETILIGFLDTSFKGVNNFTILKFVIRSVNKLKKDHFTYFINLLRKKYQKNTSIINYLYNNDVANLFVKYQHQSDFLGFFLNIIFNLPLNLFVEIEQDVYLFLDKILQNYDIDVFKKFQIYFTHLINDSILFFNQDNNQENYENNLAKQEEEILCEKKNEKDLLFNEENKDIISMRYFEEFKKILYTISLLERSLCNPIFKSFFVYEKKSDILLMLEKKLVSINKISFQDSEKLLLQIRKKILNSLIFCIDYNFGIRSLLKKSKNEKKNLRKKLVEDMPIEKHISEIFIYVFSFSHENLKKMDKDIFVKLLKIITLLCNNDLGKNVLLSLILEEENLKSNIYSFLQENDNFEKLISFLDLINIFLDNPSDPLNLKLLSLLFNLKKMEKEGEQFYQILYENLTYLKNQSKLLFEKNKEFKKEELIIHAKFIDGLEIVQKKKSKIEKRIEKKIKVKFIDEMPRDITKRIKSLNTKLSTKYFKNKIEDLIKEDNYKTLVKLTIENFQIPWNKKIKNYYQLTSEDIEYNYLLGSELIIHNILKESKNNKVWRIEFKNDIKREIYSDFTEIGFAKRVEKFSNKFSENNNYNNEEIPSIPIKPEISFLDKKEIDFFKNESYLDEAKISHLQNNMNINPMTYPSSNPQINQNQIPDISISKNQPNYFSNKLNSIPPMPINTNIPNLPLYNNIQTLPVFTNNPMMPTNFQNINKNSMRNMQNINSPNMGSYNNIPNQPMQKLPGNISFSPNQPNHIFLKNITPSPTNQYIPQTTPNLQNLNYPNINSSPYFGEKQFPAHLTPQINSPYGETNHQSNYFYLYGNPKFIPLNQINMNDPFNPFVNGGYYNNEMTAKKEISQKLKKYNFSDDEEEDEKIDAPIKKNQNDKNSFLDKFKSK